MDGSAWAPGLAAGCLVSGMDGGEPTPASWVIASTSRLLIGRTRLSVPLPWTTSLASGNTAAQRSTSLCADAPPPGAAQPATARPASTAPASTRPRRAARDRRDRRKPKDTVIVLLPDELE